MNNMKVKQISLLNRPEILNFNGEKDFFDSPGVSVPQSVQSVLQKAIIGGTQAWLGVNDDDEHAIY
jgi:hypothetical protein